MVTKQIYDHDCFKAVGINLTFCKYRPGTPRLWKLLCIIYKSQRSASIEQCPLTF